MGLFSLKSLRSISPLGSSAAPIALDFGSQTLKALQLSQEETPQIVAAAALQVPEVLQADPAKRLAWQLEQLPTLLRGAPFKGKRAVCSIPSAQLFSKHLQVQIPDEGAAGPIVASCVAVQLRCDPATLAVRHVQVQTEQPLPGGKSEVIALAASRALIHRIMQGVKGVKLEPVGIHPEPLALLRSFDYITRRAGDEAVTSLYVDLGSGSTKIVVAHGPQMVFCKTIQLGGRYLDVTVSKQKKCTLGEAHAVRLGMKSFGRPTVTSMDAAERPSAAPAKIGSMTGIPALDAQLMRESAGTIATMDHDRRTEAPPPGSQAVPDSAPGLECVDLSEPLDTLTDEIALCLRYYDTLFPNRRVMRTIFVGGEARHVGLCQHVARKLRLPAHVADPLTRFKRPPKGIVNGADFGEPQPGWSVAIGLCTAPTDL